MMYKDKFIKYMKSEGVKYTDVKSNVVRVAYNGENMNTIAVHVIFDKDDDPVAQLYCLQIANFKNNYAAGVVACNAMNAKYRWVKFYLDDDYDLMCSIDTCFDYDTCGPTCMYLVKKVVNLVDESYPVFMKALWSE